MPKPTKTRSAYWETKDGSIKLLHGDVVEQLRSLPEKSIHCIVTSPPYWGLRDYGNDKTLELGSEKTPDCLGWAKGENCGECHVCRMRLVFAELYRVLRDDGTCWLNYGSSYASGGNLIGVPWRVALALQADGWILRQDIIWVKPSPMPESVRNRCTKAHEYLFLLTKKGSGYFYDAEAIREKPSGRTDVLRGFQKPGGSRMDANNTYQIDGKVGANKRSVWTIASEIYEGAHFATFPRKLIEPCILAGTSSEGCCSECGAPWRRVVETTPLTRERPNDYVKRTGEEGTGNSCANSVAGVEARTVGWEIDCDCAWETVPCIVLDPFMGSGTTAVVAWTNGRHVIGIDLSKDYLRDNAVPRIEGALLDRRQGHLSPTVPEVEEFKGGESL